VYIGHDVFHRALFCFGGIMSDEKGWSYICYSGTKVFRRSKCDESFQDWPLVKNELKVGDEVITCVFGTYQQGIVVCKDDSGCLFVDAGSNITNLKFDEDDRHCWTTSCAFNKAAMVKVKREN